MSPARAYPILAPCIIFECANTATLGTHGFQPAGLGVVSFDCHCAPCQARRLEAVRTQGYFFASAAQFVTTVNCKLAASSRAVTKRKRSPAAVTA